MQMHKVSWEGMCFLHCCLLHCHIHYNYHHDNYDSFSLFFFMENGRRRNETVMNPLKEAGTSRLLCDYLSSLMIEKEV